jgi:hypothetical protein
VKLSPEERKGRDAEELEKAEEALWLRKKKKRSRIYMA